jgi:uncharacterized SAM-binding protein YcdF (DUF218 family)
MWSLLRFFSTNIALFIWILSIVVYLLNCRRKRKNVIIGVCVFIFIWFLGTRFFADILLNPLEYAYKSPDAASLGVLGVDEVVVLGGGA